MARQVKNGGRFSPQNYYRAPAPESKSPSRQQRRLLNAAQAKRLGRLFKVFLVLLAVVSIWYFGLVDGVKVASSGGGDDQALEAKLEQHLSGWRSIKPLINPGQLSQQIREADASIAELNLSWSLASRQLHAGVVYRRAVAAAVSGRQPLGLIGQDGVYYTGQTEENLPPIEDTGGLSSEPGQQFVPIRVLDFIRRADQSLDVLPKDIQSSRRYQLVDAAREVYLASSRGFVVKFNIERSAADQMQELAETLKFLKSKGRTPSGYIDLRVDDTAYYQ